jgi:predicted component of viral defense system (DUF524 family)
MYLIESPQVKNILSTIRYNLIDILRDLQSKKQVHDIDTTLKKILVTIEKHIQHKELSIPKAVYNDIQVKFKLELHRKYTIQDTVYCYLHFVEDIINHSV